jgi:NAD(P)-dependent dehydrogenase (short-subunit alcohol dehydrogenase family)
MSATSDLVELARHATDLIAPYSFNRMGFEMHRRGFAPDDLPDDAHGRVALVTGANSGIGYATALELARLDFDVWMLCRDEGRGQSAREAIAREVGRDRAHVAVVDMSSLASIRRAARDLPLDRVDVLVHNAGVLPDEKQLSDDGVELTFATSALGPFALTGLLLDRLSRSDDARVVFVASGGLYAQRLDLALLDVDAGSFDGVRAYANAKRAQVILAHLLANRLSATTPITFASMHPGWADTTALRNSLPKFHAMMKSVLRTPEQACDTVVWLAASPRPKGTPGNFWFDRRVALEYPLPWTRERPEVRDELFALCERLGGVAIQPAGATLG